VQARALCVENFEAGVLPKQKPVLQRRPDKQAQAKIRTWDRLCFSKASTGSAWRLACHKRLSVGGRVDGPSRNKVLVSPATRTDRRLVFLALDNNPLPRWLPLTGDVTRIGEASRQSKRQGIGVEKKGDPVGCAWQGGVRRGFEKILVQTQTGREGGEARSAFGYRGEIKALAVCARVERAQDFVVHAQGVEALRQAKRHRKEPKLPHDGSRAKHRVVFWLCTPETEAHLSS